MTSINPHTTRANGTILSATIYNSDHTNHIANAQALNAGKIEGPTPPVVDGETVLFDGTGGVTVRSSGHADVVPAASSVVGNVVTFADTAGRELADAGIPLTQVGFGTRTDIASAATTSLATITTHHANVTGTTTITSFGNSGSAARPVYLVRFDGALTLTHNATSLILPGGADITTAAGDYALVIDTGSNNWRVASYNKNSPAATDVAPGIIELAVQSEMETPASALLAVTPARQHFHPGHPKAWASFHQSGTQGLDADSGVTSIADNGTGLSTFTFDTAFGDTNYGVVGMGEELSFGGNPGLFMQRNSGGTKTATAFQIQCCNGDSSNQDTDSGTIIAVGDQ